MATTADQGTPKERQEALKECADLGSERIGRYNLYRETYDGEGATYLTDRAQEVLERQGLPYTENFGETVVDVLADALSIERFTCEDDDASTEWAQAFWDQPSSAVLQGIVHCEVPKLGDGFVILDPPAEGETHPRMRWNRPDLIKPVYPDDDCDEADYFVKVWNSKLNGTAVRRMNLYFPDRVEKWFTFSQHTDQASTGGGGGSFWMPWKDDADTTWPVWLTDSGQEGGEPLGHIVFHFRNKPQGGMFGRSELRSLIPMLNALDKQLVDLFWVMDSQGWGQRWAIAKGLKDLQMGPGEVWTTEDENAQFGQFTPDDPRPLVEAIEAQLRRIAAKSRTPLHELLTSGALPSGESLKTAEAGKISKGQDRQTDLGDPWCRMISQARRLHVLYGADAEQLNVDAPFRAEWTSIESRNEVTEAQVAQTWHDIGVSAQTLMERNGFDPELERERRREEDGDAMDRQQRLFNSAPTAPTSQLPGDSLAPRVDE